MVWRLRKIWMTLALAGVALGFSMVLTTFASPALAAGHSSLWAYSTHVTWFNTGVNYGRPKVF